MTNPPFFTILTASLNKGHFLEKTLESVRDQSFKNLEHIVIDGGSSDETLDVLYNFSNTYNLSWISQPDQGVPDALNKGISQARGKYTIVIQADDYLLEDHTLEKVYPFVEDESCDIYSFPIIKEHPIKGRVLINPIRVLWWIRFRNIFPHQGVFVHRRVFDKIGKFNVKFSITEDYDFLYRALKAQSSVKFGNIPVSFMGGAGPTSDNSFLRIRLKEEYQIHKLNEVNPFWRLAQISFWALYFPYKIIQKRY
ncbi:MAG: glycosyltransferase family 2 protein [Thermodesulfobacteriota bacterium]|nr:glycosyltransferase family 2 protein [Thermodesulfobacteriota bacterium]